MARNLMACAGPIMAEKQAPFDIEAQRPNDFVQYQKEENQADVLKQFNLTQNPKLSRGRKASFCSKGL